MEIPNWFRRKVWKYQTGCFSEVVIRWTYNTVSYREVSKGRRMADRQTILYCLPILSSFITYHRVCNEINTTGATSRAGTAYPSGAPEFTPVFSGFPVTRSLALCVCFIDHCLSFFFWPLCCLSFDLRILEKSLKIPKE